MSIPTQRDVQHIFEALRKGLVPERGIETFAVGIDKQRDELHRQFDLAGDGEGTIKFLRGGYGCGKTFMARLAVLDAQERGYATSFVVVSDNEFKFYKFEDVYSRVMSELGTSACPRSALGDILDRWIGQVEGSMIQAGADEEAPDFDAQVRDRLQQDLLALTGGKAPQDFIRVVQTIFDLKQSGEYLDAGALISWLCGSSNVGAAAKRAAGVKGSIGSREALDYLRGVLVIVKAAGYKGLVLVIDEAETILRMRKDSRHKSLNGIRQLADNVGSYPGLMWLFTGTPEFFDERRGVAGLAPLHDRIKFIKKGRFASLRQAQLELTPFDKERLRAVALRLRDIYPARDRARIERAVSRDFIDRLIDTVTQGLQGDVGIVPRQFLREYVSQLDLVDEHAEYDPMREYGFEPDHDALSTEERAALSDAPGAAPDPGDEDDQGDDALEAEDVWF